MTSILWLRRDLRLHDHAALAAAVAAGGPVQAVFVFDANILARFASPMDRRLTFIAHALCALDLELQKSGGRLLVLHGDAEQLLPRLAAGKKIFAAQDFEPGTIARDAQVAKNADLTLVKDHLIFAPGEVLKSDGTPFKVFTPYMRAWQAKLSPAEYGEYAAVAQFADVTDVAGLPCISLDQGPAHVLARIGYMPADISLWPVDGARERLAEFIGAKARNYGDARNVMAEHGTSRISPYLRFGLVSVREALRLAIEVGGAEKWISELIWREFYAMILFHYPESATLEWNPKYRGLPWSRDEKLLAAWKAGMTGYPIVDAAMRELLATGWMHNRARMIVASFFTKDLHLDWRLGEEHFAQHLMDYEMASNVGGWQWSASTGTDAQPWFRIFNPELQSRKFDPEGAYIHRFVPELAGVKGKAIHNPAPPERGRYPAAIVDHGRAREAALALFKGYLGGKPMTY